MSLKIFCLFGSSDEYGKIETKKLLIFTNYLKLVYRGYPESRKEVIRIFLQMKQPAGVRGIVEL